MANKSFQEVVRSIVIKSVDLSEREGETLRQVYDSEHGYNGLSPKACKDYLQGLPSVCTIPFYNFEILKILEQNGITRATEKGRYGLIDKYWTEAGNQFYKLIK